MVRSMFAAVSGLRTHQAKMDVIGNNIANVNTWGFKSGKMSFRDTMYQTTSPSSGGSTAVGGRGGVNANQVGYGVTAGSISYDMSKGAPVPTGRGLDCAIDGSGFFIIGPMIQNGSVSLAGGADIKNSGFFLSRVGIFEVDANGYLKDDTGNYIYGFANQDYINNNLDMTSLSVLKLPTKQDLGGTGTELAEFVSYEIKKDGSILGITKENKTVTIGKIALAGVQNVNGIEKTSGYAYTIGSNAGAVSVNEGGTAVGDILSNHLEQAKVDLASEMTDMITTQRGFQANSKIITVTDQMLEELVNLKR